MDKGSGNLYFGFFNGLDNPYLYDAEDFNTITKNLIGKDTGILGGNEQFVVTTSTPTGLHRYVVKKGFAIIGGIWVCVKEDTTIDVPVTSGQSSCIYFDIDKVLKKVDLKYDSSVITDVTTGQHLKIKLCSMDSSGAKTDYRGEVHLPYIQNNSGGLLVQTIEINASQFDISSYTINFTSEQYNILNSSETFIVNLVGDLSISGSLTFIKSSTNPVIYNSLYFSDYNMIVKMRLIQNNKGLLENIEKNEVEYVDDTWSYYNVKYAYESGRELVFKYLEEDSNTEVQAPLSYVAKPSNSSFTFTQVYGLYEYRFIISTNNEWITQVNKTVYSVNGRRGEVSGLAENNGYYETLSVGLADNLIDRKGEGTVQEIPYFRTSVGTDSITDDGNGIIHSIKGNTLVWNQLVGDLRPTQIQYGLTLTNNGDGSITINGTATQTITNLYLTGAIYGTEGHKILLFGSAIGGSMSTYHSHILLGSGADWTINPDRADIGYGAIFNCVKSNGSKDYIYGIRLYVEDGSVFNNVKLKPQIIDLTKMFGAGNEPSTVEDFKAIFPLAYYRYNEGTLLDFNGTGIKTVGFNQWDEEWENGTFNTTTGVNINTVAALNQIRSKNLIPVVPNAQYFGESPLTQPGEGLWVIFYDADLNVIQNPTFSGRKNGNSICLSKESVAICTTPSNAAYCKFYATITYGSAYNNDICINLSWSGYRNGEYEPYWTRTLDLPTLTYFPDGMKSAGITYDEILPNKAINRIGKVDLGTLSYWTDLFSGYSAIYAIVPSIKENTLNCVCSKYSYKGVVEASSLTDKSISIRGGTAFSKTILIKDTSYSSVEEFITAMSGVYLYYELAEPDETPIDPPLDLTYKVADFGTEALVSDDSTTPFVGIIKYSDDFTRQLANMKKNYQSQDSMDGLLSALGTACGGTFLKIWDGSKWTYTFTRSE